MGNELTLYNMNGDAEDKRPKKTLAKQRWLILARALRGESAANTGNSAASVRRFNSYGLLKTEPLSKSDKQCGATWHRYTCPDVPDFSMDIRHLPGTITPEAVFGFNNTGNVCVWPSEEVLSYYFRNTSFSDMTVLELGGGMTCLAGIMTAMLSDAGHVMVTDGNEEAVENLNIIIESNKDKFRNTKVTTRVLRWGCGKIDEELKEKFDYILCADCMFFEEGRSDLVEMVYCMLKPEGKTVMFAPNRGKTFDEFVALTTEKFNTSVEDKYDQKIWDLHCKMKAKGIEHYDENIHFSRMLTLTKKTGS